jgi:poly(A) polymerase
VQQKNYPASHHQLPIDKIDPDALYVMEKLRLAGYTAYLVGGSVRDLLLQRKPKDFDISTSAEPEEIKKLFRNSILIGRRFRLAHIRFGRKILEVSTFRAGDNEADTLIVRDNVWGSPEEDATRRDFTINGLLYDASTQTIIDYVEGYADIEKKLLRTIGQPYLRFKQDPVRMIRLVKFQARFGFEIDRDTQIALIECRQEILKSSQARILEELLRMLESGSATRFFRLMTDQGLLQLLLPEIARFLEKAEGDEVFSYLEEVDDTAHDPDQPPFDRAILLSCLLFPLLQNRIKTRYLDRGHYPHLGEIQDECYHLTEDVFDHFFLLPRRLRLGVVSTLTSQYRLTPLEKRSNRRIRIPTDPDFPLALRFLELRACLEPGLEEIVAEWTEASSSTAPAPAKKRRRKRRRKRAPGASSEPSDG